MGVSEFMDPQTLALSSNQSNGSNVSDPSMDGLMEITMEDIKQIQNGTTSIAEIKQKNRFIITKQIHTEYNTITNDSDNHSETEMSRSETMESIETATNYGNRTERNMSIDTLDLVTNNRTTIDLITNNRTTIGSVSDLFAVIKNQKTN